MNLANRISIARIILVPFFVVSVAYLQFKAALVIFGICIVSDALDGYIARVKGQGTRLGSLLDPIADKLLLISGFIALSVVKDPALSLRFPPYVPLTVVSKDVLIILGCVVIYILKGKVDIRPTCLGKLTTLFQMLSIVGILTQFVYSGILWNATVILTIISGLDYLRIGTRVLNEAS